MQSISPLGNPAVLFETKLPEIEIFLYHAEIGFNTLKIQKIGGNSLDGSEVSLEEEYR